MSGEEKMILTRKNVNEREKQRVEKQQSDNEVCILSPFFNERKIGFDKGMTTLVGGI